jgi:hypothetical protein
MTKKIEEGRRNVIQNIREQIESDKPRPLPSTFFFQLLSTSSPTTEHSPSC